MSNNKDRISKQKILSEKQRVKQKKMLLEMKNEIKSLENQINNYEKTNRKIKAVRNLKISARALQRVAPYVLTAGITFGTFSLLKVTPFIKDDKKQNSEVMKEIDSLGNIRYEQQYSSFNSENILYYCTKWKKNKDGLYSRTVKSYFINEYAYKEAIKLLDKEKCQLEDILGKPISTITETKNNISEEELKEESYIKVQIYDVDKNDYIIVKESTGDNIGFTVIYILMTILGEMIPFMWRDWSSNFDFDECVEKIKESHQPVDVKKLEKKLEIKKSNYNMLTR